MSEIEQGCVLLTCGREEGLRDSLGTEMISVMSSFQLIQKGTKLVLEQVVTSIASVADTAEEKFVPYYDLFMPSLKHIVENAVQKELRLLRGKTIECISLIGLAVGKEKVGGVCCWIGFL